ncbi:recombinase family protein [Metabacillus litoralis]|uniref:Integrase n=1 Tax=Metabacillus litoralis TaxID=152268 RepID=A0A179SUZ2_9BACI|nr:recombinase family protein [Metabacillus litoralis]OAS85098.1 integrase [Metabacillus litoralis]
MIFGYARTSTKKQSLDMQLDELNRFGVDEIITEQASGAKKDRVELNNLLGKLRKGDVLVVYKLDRLGRTMHQLVNLLNDFQEKGIEFVSIKDGINTSTTMGRFLFNIFGAMAEMEREVINERVVSGVESAKARGRLGGRKKAHTKEQIKGMLAMLEHGRSKKEVQEMFVVSRTTLYRYIKENEESI